MVRNIISTLSKAYTEHSKHGDFRYKYAGFVATVGYPFFGFIYGYVLVQEYVGTELRIIATGLALIMALRDRWPKPIKSYYPIVTYLAILFILPFFHTVMILHNADNTIFVRDSMMAMFFTIFMVDWRNMILMYVVGTILGIAYYAMTASVFSIPSSYIEAIPTIILATIGGYVFKYTNEKIIIQEKLETAKALGASIAHEMRNPLNSLKLVLKTIESNLPKKNTKLLKINKSQNITVHEMIDMGFKSIDRSYKIIDLTLKNIKGEPIDKSAFVFLSIAQCIRENLNSYGYQEGEKQKISTHLSNEFIFKGDATIFAFILFNLMKNSFYYLSIYPNSQIIIWLERDKEANKLHFKDTGPGIPENVLGQLFNDFVSVGKKTGTGLGLSYCKRAMSSFGGDIVCDSIEGEYTRFTLLFPVYNEDEISTVINVQDQFTHLSADKILIVDDNEIDRISTKALFKNTNFHIDLAEDGSQAIKRMKKKNYDLILMDLNMPEERGTLVTKRIRDGAVFSVGESPNHKIVPIFAYTSEDLKVNRKSIKQSGMNGYLQKPMQKKAMVETIHSWLTAPDNNRLLPVFKKLRVLIVDDVAMNRTLVEKLLLARGIGYVRQATCGDEAIQDVKKNHYDLVLLDINMPKINGLETAKIIRKTNKNVILIGLSAESEPEAISQALRAGMDDYILKPVSEKSLIFKLHSWFCKDKDINIVKSNDQKIDATDQLSIIGSPISLSKINELKSYFDEINQFNLLVNKFLVDMKYFIKNFKKYLLADNINDCKRELHKIKGPCGSLGVTELNKQVIHIEGLLKSGTLPINIEDIMLKLEQIIKSTEKELINIIGG